MPGPEVVIVAKDGTEHVFPPGFDPVKAARIVIGGASALPPSVSTPLVERMGARPTGGYSTSDFAAPPAIPAGSYDFLSSAAHPKTVSDVLSLLIPSEVSGLLGKSAQTGADALTMADVGKGVVRGVKSAVMSPTRSIAGTAIGSMVGGHEGAAIGAGVSAIPTIIRGIRDVQSERIVSNPSNVQRAFKAVTDASKGRSMTLSAADISDVADQLRGPESVTLPFAEETGGASGAVSGPNRLGAKSYGTMGDRGAWIQRKIAETSPPTTPAAPLSATVRPLTDASALVPPQASAMLTPQEQALIDQLWQQQAKTRAIGRTYPNPEFVPQGLESSYPGQGR